MENRKIVDKKEILRVRTASNIGIYCSSDRVGTVYNKCSKIPPSISILDDRMTGQNYLDFLQNKLPKQLEGVLLATRIAMYFQNDGASYHYTRHVMQHLNDTFTNMRIDSGSTINWPPRSPDLTPLYFCLWGLMKSEVYRKKWIHEMNCSLTYWMLSPA